MREYLIHPEEGFIEVKRKIVNKTGGYTIINYKGKPVAVHRIIWEHVNGPVPEGLFIDHINGIKHDNRLCNLRLVTTAQNGQNRKAPKNNKTGVKGVFYSEKKQKYVVQIKFMRKSHYLGQYDTLVEAADAYAFGASLFHTHNPSVK